MITEMNAKELEAVAKYNEGLRDEEFVRVRHAVDLGAFDFKKARTALDAAERFDNRAKALCRQAKGNADAK